MVGYPVEDNFETHLVGLGQEMLEVGTCTELGVDGAVVDDGVVAAQRALAGDLADRLTGHYPDDVNTILFEGREQRLGGPERTFRRSLTGVEFVDSSVVRPFRVTQLDLFCAARKSQESQRKEECLFLSHKGTINFIFHSFVIL